MKNVFLIVALTILACACRGDKLPKNLIDKDKFEALYIELLDSAAADKDSANVKLKPTAERILERRQVSIDQLKATVNYYNADSKRWKLFYEDVVKKVNEQSLKNTTR